MAPGEVAPGEGNPIKPVRDSLEAHRSGCSPIGGKAKMPLRPARIEAPMLPRRFDSARHDRGRWRGRGLDLLTLGPAADSEPPPPRAPPAVARLGPPSQPRADFARQFPLGALIGNALTLAGFRGLAHHCSFSIGQENRTGLSAPRPGVVVGEKVRSLRGFRARSMRSDSIPQICADSYKS